VFSVAAENPFLMTQLPLLAVMQGGVAEQSKDIAKHPLPARPGWFTDRTKKENHPVCVDSVAARNSS